MDNFKLLLSKKTIFGTQFSWYYPFHVFHLVLLFLFIVPQIAILLIKILIHWEDWTMENIPFNIGLALISEKRLLHLHAIFISVLLATLEKTESVLGTVLLM